MKFPVADGLDGGLVEDRVAGLLDFDGGHVAVFVDDELGQGEALEAAASGGGGIPGRALALGLGFVLEVADVKDFESAEVLLVHIEGGQGEISGEGATGARVECHVELFEGNGGRRRVEFRRRLFLLRLGGRRLVLRAEDAGGEGLTSIASDLLGLAFRYSVKI